MSSYWKDRLEDEFYHDLYDEYQNEKREEAKRLRQRWADLEAKSRSNPEYQRRLAEENKNKMHRDAMHEKAQKAVPNSLIKMLYESHRVIRIVLSILVTLVLAIINPITLISMIPFLLFFAKSDRGNFLDEISDYLLGAGCIALVIFAFYGGLWFGLAFLVVSAIAGFTLFEDKEWLASTIIGLSFDIGVAIFYDGATFAYSFFATLLVIFCFMLCNVYSDSNPIRKQYYYKARRSMSRELYNYL